ncbi:MAG TPA: protein kinase [Methylomirabilota bacterium]|nr:protein kinase [Methylomirabilota bacterium]
MPAEGTNRETLVGQTLGHYRILEKIGAGGMGEVYRAHDEHLEREVAIKVLAPGTLTDETSRKRFRKEALALSKLNHPNIATVHDFDTQRGLDFLVMEYIRGTSLSERLATRPLGEKEIINLGTQLAEGLCIAHEHGVVHRDLKPGNLRVTEDGRLKILDFGLAKLFDPASGGLRAETLTQSLDDAHLMGTLPYMAPEQVSGEHVDARTDIYGVGAVLYEMATKQRPFREESAQRLFASILRETVVAPREINPRLSAELERIILKCLEKDPGRRFQSARELAVDLDRCAHPSETQLTRSGSKPLWPRVAGLVRTHPLLSTSSSLAIAALAVVLWWVFGARPVLSFAPRNFILISDFDNQTGDPLFDRSLLTALSVSIEQSSRVNVIPPSRIAQSLRRMGRKPGEKIDENLGRQICVREYVPALLAPAISRVGQQYVLSARIVNPQNGISVWSYIETATNQNEILPALGKLAAAVRHNLGESRFAMQRKDRPLPLVTTSSLSALKMYVDGQDLWRKGQYQQGMQLWNSALKEDPDFAMAHVASGGALYSYIFNNPVEGKKHYERALELSDRTTERERLFVRAMFAYSQNHFSDASQLFREYLQEYPDDSGARFSLAHLLRDNNRCAEAVPQYEEVLRVDPGSAGAMIDIATCNGTQNHLAEAIRYYEQAFQLEPSWGKGGNLAHEYGMVLVRAGQEAKAREIFKEAAANPDTRTLALRSLAYLDLYHGHYHAAKASMEEALLLNQSRHVALSAERDHCILALLYEGLGDNKSAIRELDAAMQLYPTIADKMISGHWLSLGYVRAGQVEKAAAVLETMKKQADMNDASHASLINYSQAEVDRLRGNTARAIELLLIAEQQKPAAFNYDGLARVYEATGENEQAARWLKTLNEQQALGYEAQLDWMSSFVRLARVDVALGKKDEAKALLSQFLDLWKDADPEIPLLKEAKTEYQKLQ